MKTIVKILTSLSLSLALFTACDKTGGKLGTKITADKTTLNPFEASGNAEQVIKVTGDGEWVATAPQWISLSAYHGKGNMEVKVKVQDNLTGTEKNAPREGFISFSTGTSNVEIPVRQRGDKSKLIVLFKTVKIEDFLKKKDDKEAWFHVKGTIASIASADYGNLTIKDGDKELYVYGVTATKQHKNDKSFASLNLKVGDILNIACYKSSYNGNAQAAGAYIYDPTKQNLQVSPTSVKLPKEAGKVTLDIIAKGEYTVTVDAAASWITIEKEEKVDGLAYLKISANTAETPRSGKVTVKLNDASQEVNVYINQSGVEPAKSTIKDALTKTYAHVQGQVAALTTQGFLLADETGKIYVYTKDPVSFKIGDKIKVCGKVSAYNFGAQIGNDVVENLGKADYKAPEAVKLDKTGLDALLQSVTGKDKAKLSDVIEVKFVEVACKVAVNGKYVNLKVEGTTNDLSVYNPLKTLKFEDKKAVTVKGYIIQLSVPKNKPVSHATIIVTEVK